MAQTKAQMMAEKISKESNSAHMMVEQTSGKRSLT